MEILSFSLNTIVTDQDQDVERQQFERTVRSGEL
jgi:hypothetical protein